MLWLTTDQILYPVSKDIFIGRLLDLNFELKKVLSYSKNSLVGLSKDNSIVKIYNPQIGDLFVQNWIAADKIMTTLGIKTPSIISIKSTENFNIIEMSRVAIISRTQNDNLFRTIFDIFMSAPISNSFGFVNKNILVPSVNKISYSQYWEYEWEYYNKKIVNYGYKSLLTKEKYKFFYDKLDNPKQFILSHTDISPKHVFGTKSNPGLIDIDETMYLDTSFMCALWIVRSSNLDIKVMNNILMRYSINYDWLKFHVYRELVIQCYHTKKLSEFNKLYFHKCSFFNRNYN